MRVPSHVYDQQLRLRRAEERLGRQLGRTPGRDDLGLGGGALETGVGSVTSHDTSAESNFIWVVPGNGDFDNPVPPPAD